MDHIVFVALAIALAGFLRSAGRKGELREMKRQLSDIEGKLDLLLKNAGIKYEPYGHMPPDVQHAIQSGLKIKAIKLYRESSGMGLKESKERVEAFMRQMGQ